MITLTLSHSSIAETAAEATPAPIARRVRRLLRQGDRLGFHRPRHITLLLAINIFPLLWAIYLSFTNYRANRPNAAVEGVGLRNYERVLTDPDIWQAMQTTAHFVFRTIVLQTVIGFALAYLIDRKSASRPRLLDDDHPDPDDAVAGRGRQFLALPL